ncbi:glycine cleavage system protein GcvH [Streptomonospora nanhaiensis]|uniref:Glycine cleavage system H protein n=1 Tax=Streptomonospora nanhaiensis TaxID=1323731 RepID=A0A853BTF8_9ACTN|nr:glycine cleavage system protein GcvH [Streptomonospora nanhaiensis]MBV2362645.1 glycine cleavage system protein GcvH [Streptomonospora nanhaiensis]MBX9387281.1 glycine cleavage system protein GcvH [Streptomonospora nanhaiensis]NYI98005.1 glycine cleavage system H protein [Streptomonospora nanhaiensis]
MSVPAELHYTSEHEWVAVADGVATVGITAYAAEALGDIVFVELPEVGGTVSSGDTCGEVESTKSVSDLYSPVNGEVVAVNEAAVADPEVIGTDPYGQGWLFKVEVSEEPADLLSPEQYTQLTEGEG